MVWYGMGVVPALSASARGGGGGGGGVSIVHQGTLLNVVKNIFHEHGTCFLQS